MKNILITAYDVNPYKGSESATGWNYPYQLSKSNKVTLVTRENNISEIFRYIQENDLEVNNFEVLGFDLPSWARFWKRGVRGSFLYFYLWQFFLSIKFFKKREEFDICHSLNFHCDWAPSFLWLLGRPFVWGPINHNEKLPLYLFKGEGVKALVKDKVNNLFKFLFWNFDPFLFLCKSKADRILVGHSGVIEELNLDRKKCHLFNQISTDIPQDEVCRSPGFNVLFAGRGLLIKNYPVVLEAAKRCIALQSNDDFEFSITFVGVGGVKKKIHELAVQLGISGCLDVHEWVPFDKMPDYYKAASVLCFPSFEGAGMVIAESLSYGTPVITIDQNGASHELDPCCSFVVSSESRNAMIEGLSLSMNELLNDKEKLRKMSLASREYAEEKLSWATKSDIISNIYSTLNEK